MGIAMQARKDMWRLVREFERAYHADCVQLLEQLHISYFVSERPLKSLAKVFDEEECFLIQAFDHVAFAGAIKAIELFGAEQARDEKELSIKLEKSAIEKILADERNKQVDECHRRLFEIQEKAISDIKAVCGSLESPKHYVGMVEREQLQMSKRVNNVSNLPKWNINQRKSR